MALSKEEIEKVNDLFRQIDEKEQTIKSKESLLTEKEILLNKTRVSLNEKQSILVNKDSELTQIKQEMIENQKQMMCYKQVQQQLINLTEKVDRVLEKVVSDQPVRKVSKTTSTASKKK